MGRWLLRMSIGALALLGALVVVSAGMLWLMAAPVLEQAKANYAALSTEAQCAGGAYPPGYPNARRAVQTSHDIELSVYRDACADADLGSHCAYMSGGLRRLGFSVYRSASLSQCEMHALNLHGDTPLHAALETLYPGHDPAALSEPELTCVALAARAGVRAACRGDATCCADSGVAQTLEMPR